MKYESDEKKKQRNKIVADNIKYYQLQNNISTSKLSKLTGISESGLRNYRSGLRMPDTKRLYSIANALGVMPKDLKKSHNILEKLENELLKYNFSANELQAIIEELYHEYCISITKPTISSSVAKYTKTAVKRCKKIIDLYLLNHIESNSSDKEYSLSFVATLLEDINYEYILNSYSVPIYSFLDFKKSNGIFENLKPVSRFIVTRNNLESNYKYFGINIDMGSYEPSYAFEYNSTIILKRTNEISAYEIGLFTYLPSKESKEYYVDLLKLDGLDNKNYPYYHFVSAQDGRNSPMPYAIEKENLKDFKLNLIGVVSLVFLPQNKENTHITFKIKE